MIDKKFRAWDKENNLLITHEQDFVPLKVTNIGVFRQDCDSGKWELLGRDKFILTESLGATDMHGTEVYEGDIITSHVKDLSGKMSVGIVARFDAKLGIVCLSDINCPAFEDATNSGRIQFVKDFCTVLGNVFEDSELLPESARDYFQFLESLESRSTTPSIERAPEYKAPCCRLP